MRCPGWILFGLLPCMLMVACESTETPSIDLGSTDTATVDPGTGTDTATVDPGTGTDTATVDPGTGTDTATVDPGTGTDTGAVDPGTGTDTGTEVGQEDVGGQDVPPAPCLEDIDCADAFPSLSECRKAVCNKLTGECVTENLEDDTECGLDDACIQNGKCAGGNCVGTALVCDDSDPCTENWCDPTSGCVHPSKPDNTPCDDGLPCTDNNVCIGGICLGSPRSCDDGDPCTTDTCDPGTGCVNTFVAGTGCNDGDACTLEDKCVLVPAAGDEEEWRGCRGTPMVCPTGNPCTSSACVDGACSAPALVADGTPCATDVCKTGMTCLGGGCQGGAALVCDDGKACTDDFCAGGCQAVFDATNSCSDGNSCTHSDKCLSADSCQGTAYTCPEINPRCDGKGGCYCLPGQLGEKPMVCDERSNVCATRVGCQCTSNTNNVPCPEGKVCSIRGCVTPL